MKLKKSIKKFVPNLRDEFTKKTKDSEVPIIAYISVLITFLLLFLLREESELAADFLPEIFGVVFTLFIIDILLVRSKTKRWKIVRTNIDYLIARNINRLRDGIATRVFNFSPKINHNLSENENFNNSRQQRAVFLSGIEKLDPKSIMNQIDEKEFFCDENYLYFNEKADELWSILNMKYSEYLAPELVSQLIDLCTLLKDVCAHIKQYKKMERFSKDRAYYRKSSMQGLSLTLKEILELVNILKKEGYSESAKR